MEKKKNQKYEAQVQIDFSNMSHIKWRTLDHDLINGQY